LIENDNNSLATEHILIFNRLTGQMIWLLAIVEHAFSPHGILAFEKLVYIIHFQQYYNI